MEGFLPQLILIIFLTLINAFFAASELAILSVNQTKIKTMADKGSKNARIVMSFNENQTKLLSTIQVGITLAGFFSSATAATALADDFAQFLVSLGLPYMLDFSMVVITLILAYITLVFGELFPKRVALRFPEKVAVFVSPIIKMVTIIALPFVKLLSASCNLLVKITRIEKNMVREKISEEEIKSILKIGATDGVLSKDEFKYINSVLVFDDIEAHEIMTPRLNCFVLDVNLPFDVQMAQISEEKYSRIPFYEGSKDNIIGILILKDILFALQKNEKVDLRSLLREPVFSTKHAKIDDLFKELLNKQTEMAIVIDEFGSFNGIVTMEDIIEELVGNIKDEYDEGNEIQKIDDKTYIVLGTTSILDINRYTDIKYERLDEVYNTISGLIIHLLGHIPKEKDEVSIDYMNTTIKVEKIKRNRIERVRITRNK